MKKASALIALLWSLFQGCAAAQQLQSFPDPLYEAGQWPSKADPDINPAHAMAAFAAVRPLPSIKTNHLSWEPWTQSNQPLLYVEVQENQLTNPSEPWNVIARVTNGNACDVPLTNAPWTNYWNDYDTNGVVIGQSTNVSSGDFFRLNFVYQP